jgi:hypothetical protein
MKIFKAALHYWFVMISIVSFLAGWGMLAHSLKPILPTETTDENPSLRLSLPPIHAYDGGLGNGNGNGNGLIFSTQNNQSAYYPILRSGGS